MSMYSVERAEAIYGSAMLAASNTYDPSALDALGWSLEERAGNAAVAVLVAQLVEMSDEDRRMTLSYLWGRTGLLPGDPEVGHADS